MSVSEKQLNGDGMTARQRRDFETHNIIIMQAYQDIYVECKAQSARGGKRDWRKIQKLVDVCTERKLRFHEMLDELDKPKVVKGKR